MEELINIVTFILISSVKFAFGIPFVSISERYTFNWLETTVYAIIGGMLGVIVFMYFSDAMLILWNRLRTYFFRRKKMREELFSPPVADVEGNLKIRYDYVDHNPPPRKIFTSRTRRIVRVWNRYGLIGLAAITPVFLSIPVGTFFIARLERNKKRILLYMFISIATWSVLLATLFHFTSFKRLEDFFQ